MTLYEKTLIELRAMKYIALGEIEESIANHLWELGYEKSQYNPMWMNGTMKQATWKQKLKELD